MNSGSSLLSKQDYALAQKQIINGLTTGAVKS